MHYLLADLWWFFAATLFTALLALNLGLALLPINRTQRLRLLLGLMLLLASILVLSGCGTVPLPALMRLQVPAELLTPPRPPVLLTPGLGLRPPGPTTPPMPRPAPLTGSGTSV